MDERDVVSRAEAAIQVEDYQMAVALLEPLVRDEDPRAMSTMGLLLQNGLGVPRNIARAIALLEKAAALGNGYAAHNLGTLYAMGGLDDRADPELSRRWYLRARELGMVAAPDSWYESLRREEGNP